MLNAKSILSTILLGASALATSQLEARINGADCYGAAHGEGFHPKTGFSATASSLLRLCKSQVAAQGYTNNVLAIPSCVAAYTSQSGEEVAASLACAHPDSNYNGTAIPHLDFNIYAQIVGNCAWDQPEACPITQQNFIDFIYGQVQATDDKQWPSSVDLVIQWWDYIVGWTATGDTTPYHNFDDFLHYSY